MPLCLPCPTGFTGAPGKSPANSQRILLVVVLVIEIETTQAEHEDENDDEGDP